MVDDLEIAATGELLELDQCKIGFNTCGVAIHEKTNGSGWRQHTGLSIAVAVSLATLQGQVP